MAKEKKEKTAAKAQNDKNEAQEKLEALEKEVAELKEKLAKEKDDYMRLMAEFETFRRRTAEEKLALVGSAATDTIKGMLPVLDDLLSGSSDEAAKEGTTLIYDKLFAYLKGKGLEVIDAKGQPFDTDLHEAVSQFPVQDEEAKGKVFDVVQTGYKLGGKVIRYAKVVVGV